jgi:hypothetical protein
MFFFETVSWLVRMVVLAFLKAIGAFLFFGGLLFVVIESNSIMEGDYESTLSYVGIRLGMPTYSAFALFFSFIFLGGAILFFGMPRYPRREEHL